MILLSFVIGVDTFFVLSGLLVTINTLKHLEKTYVCLEIVFIKYPAFKMQ